MVYIWINNRPRLLEKLKIQLNTTTSIYSENERRLMPKNQNESISHFQRTTVMGKAPHGESCPEQSDSRKQGTNGKIQSIIEDVCIAHWRKKRRGPWCLTAQYHQQWATQVIHPRQDGHRISRQQKSHKMLNLADQQAIMHEPLTWKNWNTNSVTLHETSK